MKGLILVLGLIYSIALAFLQQIDYFSIESYFVLFGSIWNYSGLSW